MFTPTLLNISVGARINLVVSFANFGLVIAQDREEMSDVEDSETEHEDMDSDSDGDTAELNIRSLVSGNKRRKDASMSASPPPSSRARTGA